MAKAESKQVGSGLAGSCEVGVVDSTTTFYGWPDLAGGIGRVAHAPSTMHMLTTLPLSCGLPPVAMVKVGLSVVITLLVPGCWSMERERGEIRSFWPKW